MLCQLHSFKKKKKEKDYLKTVFSFFDKYLFAVVVQ